MHNNHLKYQVWQVTSKGERIWIASFAIRSHAQLFVENESNKPDPRTLEIAEPELSARIVKPIQN
jgi:hypothetical protein